MDIPYPFQSESRALNKSHLGWPLISILIYLFFEGSTLKPPKYTSKSVSYEAVSYGWVTLRPTWRATVRPRWRVTVRPRWRVTVRPRWRVTVRPRWRVTVRPRWRVTVRPRWRVTVKPRWRVTVRPRWQVNGKMNYCNARKSSKIVFLNFSFLLKIKSSGDI